jgi:nitric oxide dioxygenase
MLETIAQTTPNRPAAFIHASKNEGVQPFRSDIDELMDELENGDACYILENPNNVSLCHFSGYVNKEILEAYVDSDTECYVCGPAPFMKAVIITLKEIGLPEDKINFEFFGPAMDLSSVDEKEKVRV